VSVNVTVYQQIQDGKEPREPWVTNQRSSVRQKEASFLKGPEKRKKILALGNTKGPQDKGGLWGNGPERRLRR